MLAGVDEVGRGPLAGPVVTAAVILSPDDPFLGRYRDSKKVAEKKRLKLYHHLRRHAVAYAVSMASVEEIDRLNILHATMLAMRRSVDALGVKPTRVLVDGNRVPLLAIPAEAVVGGDASVQEIAAASIMAKVVRDRLMQKIHAKFPVYGFAGHKGYGTAGHLQALREHGPCIWHRSSFAPVARCMLNTVQGRGTEI
ncbi:MAG: ribonuclease HII [Zetaproteobacteria bacterium CG06_land_8_20_14_3_00_59_53]|nr:MAG: ribonuclease HII [Zetaproteobacteria bacterium CG2_30_59_37]PIO88953.1 MAG: ribonuclease HII [Zetaproteobacteria bacterium CG23_combo_of_CG06-09_8_20_14_all_59_86]PIQ65258.1 MAG: ribonuclease HII [Zetaproteobacteria bacterium CG11_big_fil_rev_8_21_14_0_20_59_439]PIU70836.1 MAG: ribonuclease HII [Zetaproteobacteria bacterium CG06_land_8_20_14_3_00_59_53]PIU96507.1 MAG: ribonuclease HII [Zetaproteobacteria bacterium CG03_land_8_20_14_0_80_59_51]PIY45380.1 MAG: ribonuclease HII [Zetaprote